MAMSPLTVERLGRVDKAHLFVPGTADRSAYPPTVDCRWKRFAFSALQISRQFIMLQNTNT
jgi:hypothetical protein